ncbi:ATP-binding cassette domain-containing protein [Microbacterium sp.]|uniref:ATP-binding cassette domain-containing protein n=1 Tax=Microbacterium sp. TaxID=51671 RepID=UPI0037C56CD7
MPEGQVLEFSRVTKRFGAVTAVSDFSARIEPGVVTGFLGPNGAGKTTSLRILLGLVGATEGTATIGGVPYAGLKRPLQTVGAVLEASSFHPGRTAANHLKVYAQAAGIASSRVDETLATVGLAEVAGRKVGGFSLGMRQRLGLAYALLGDPGVLVLDEPANGLDPEGIKWMRGLLRQLARQGRTVLVSSHLLAEVQQTVDALLVISQGRLVFQGGLPELVDPAEYATVVDAPDRAALSQALRSAGIDFEVLRSGLTVRGVDTAQVGQAAAAAGVALSTLQRRGPGLEEVFLDLVSGVRVHASAAGLGGTTAPEQDAAEAAPAVAVAEEPVVDEAATEVAEADAAAPDAAAGEAAAGEAAAGEALEGAAAEDDAAPREAAGFAVASTGVIEVISAAEAAEAAGDVEPEPAGEPEPAPEQEAAAEPEPEADAESEPVPGEDAAGEPADRVWAMPAAAHADEEHAAEEHAGEEHAAEDSAEDADGQPILDEAIEGEEPADDGLDEQAADDRTEADIEADRFFSSFDTGDEQTGEPEASDPPEPEPEPETEPEAEAGDAPGASDDEPEGGELR